MIENDNKKFVGANFNDDPIVEEVRRAREELFARFNYDLRALGKFLQDRTEERKGAASPPRQASIKPTKKVG